MSDEAADTTAAPTTADTTAAPVESVDTSPDTSPDTSSDTSSDTDSDAPSVFDWNGEVDGLGEAEWFSSLDDSLRETVLKGLETKYQNWQRGYTKAFGENATRRKDLDSRENEIREQEVRVQRWLHGDIDPLTEKQKEIDDQIESLAKTIQQLMEEHAAAVEAAKGADQVEYDKAVKELSETRQQLDTILTEKAATEKAELEQRTDEFENWVRVNEPDIMDNHEAFLNLCVLLTGGAKLDQAIAMVRGAFPRPSVEAVPEPEPVPQPEPVPESVSLMNMGTGQSAGTTKTTNESARDVIDRMRRAAQISEGGLFGGS